MSKPDMETLLLTPNHLAEPSKELPEIFYQEIGFLHRREVPSLWHLGPLLKVVSSFDPFARWKPDFLWEIHPFNRIESI